MHNHVLDDWKHFEWKISLYNFAVHNRHLFVPNCHRKARIIEKNLPLIVFLVTQNMIMHFGSVFKYLHQKCLLF